MIDIAGVRAAYKIFEINDLGSIRTQFNPADAFTKPELCGAVTVR
jgi:hypothetical protein